MIDQILCEIDLDLNFDSLTELSEIAKDTFSKLPIVIHFKEKYLLPILEDGYYRCFRETGVSNVSTTDIKIRENIEKVSFGKYYKDNPMFIKYGALLISESTHGTSRLFGYGDIYFVLKPHIKESCTFTWDDTWNVSERNDVFLIKNPYFNNVAKNQFDTINLLELKEKRTVDWHIGYYIEVQIHSPIKIDEAVESINCPKRLEGDGKYATYFETLENRGVHIYYY
jgi:hypothetical protein